MTPNRRGAFLDLSPSVIYVMWRREMLRYVRDRSQIFGGLSRTILWLVILGFGLGAALREIDGYTYSDYVLPGVITLNVLFASLQASISLVWDRNVGLLREVMVSPAPILSVTLGKLIGGATTAVLQGSIPLILVLGARIFYGMFGDDSADQPFKGIDLTLLSVLGALVVMFFMGILMTSLGVFIASRLKTFEGFGSISNGLIQPLYFLSGSIFPLRGVIGGAGVLDIPDDLRRELVRYGVYQIGGGWSITLPWWIQSLVLVNPVSYTLDLLRLMLMGYRQLPLVADLSVTFGLPIIGVLIAARAMSRIMRSGVPRVSRRRPAPVEAPAQ